MLTLVHLVVSLGMLVIVPLGLSLVEVSGGTTVRRWWLAAAVPGVLSLWLSRGALSITLASIYLAGTLVLAVLAAADLVRRKRLRAREVALHTALLTPSIAALSLVAERSSYELFGFNLTVLSLTVAHFHFAGFAAALVACLVVESISNQAATAAAISVPLGTGIVLLGFFLGDPVELLGAAVLTAGMWLVGWAMWRRSQTADRTTKVLLVVSASTLVVTMVLALSWALGHVVATPYLPLRWMVATHGLANALGFALCGLLAWRRLKEWDEAR
ncbi:YndJ family protein [Kribbella catacumbae]|uniref:YndJ family protein n=1 Tax=Kribbella catacumbae TaxID=460086 RepID=UPI0003669258|nr:YndJ family protein [Kribbella catacumbae]